MKLDTLIENHIHFFLNNELPGPILDLACGDCHNGISLAKYDLPVWCCDASATELKRAAQLAEQNGVVVKIWQKNLEKDSLTPLPENSFAGILVFRYLHRPLMQNIKNALKNGGLLAYETYLVGQEKFGKPSNPNYLLKPDELLGYFADWHILHYFEGLQSNPQRAIAQIVCRKPDDS